MFEIKVDEAQARKEVDGLLAFRKKLPSKVADLEKPISVVVEAITLGLVTIDENYKTTQKLLEPVLDITGNEVFSELEYKPRLDPATLAKRLNDIKPGSNAGVLTQVYASLATGKTAGELNKMEPTDKEISDAITALFF